MNDTNHGLGLGVEGSGEIGSVMLLVTDAGAEGMRSVIFKDAAGGVVEEEMPSLAAHISQGESADHVGSNSFNLVSLAPVHVGSTGDPRRVEHVARVQPPY